MFFFEAHLSNEKKPWLFRLEGGLYYNVLQGLYLIIGIPIKQRVSLKVFFSWQKWPLGHFVQMNANAYSTCGLLVVWALGVIPL